MPLGGKCLCGEISYNTDADAVMTANCHCTDCRAATGAAYATMAFVKRDDLTINGTLRSYQHMSDAGSTMTKHFCGNCGSQMFTENTSKAGMMGVRIGHIEQANELQPAFNVYCSSKIASTPLNPDLPAHDKMPG